MRRNVIICCAARNELHNLSRLVPAWQQYADHIVIADQGSTDGSREFLNHFPNVHIINNSDQEFNEATRSQLLTDKARSICRNAVLLFLDADETLSANVRTSPEWQSFLASEPGTTGFFRWVTLWGSSRRYIREGKPGGPDHLPFGFIDDDRSAEGMTFMHGPRGPGLANPTRRFYFNDIVNMHFFLTNRSVYYKKQTWYKFYWILKGGSYFHTNRNHAIYDKIGYDDTKPCPVEWLDSFLSNGLDLTSTCSPELLWYDVELLQYFYKHGTRKFWLADIWNQDWEHLRKIALAKGYKDIPANPIELPPRWIRYYTDITLGRRTVSGTLRSLRRFLKRKILP